MNLLNDVQLGIQSWCFRGLKDNNGIIKALLQCDINTIELCRLHVDIKNPTQVHDVLKMYNDNNIFINSFGINKFSNDMETIRPMFEFAQNAGIRILGADPDPDAFELLEKLCNEYSIKLAIHNHGRAHRYGTMKQLDEVFCITSENIGLCLDTGWMIDAGEDPVKAVIKYSDRLYGVHFKDFVINNDGIADEVVLGTGALNLKELVNALINIGFNGYASIEYEKDVDNPVPGIIKCIKELELNLN